MSSPAAWLASMRRWAYSGQLCFHAGTALCRAVRACRVSASGTFRRRPLGAGVSCGQGAVRLFQVSPDEPVELLQLTRVRNQHVLGDRVEFLRGLDGLAVSLDHSGIDHVQGAEMLDCGCPADRVVIPAALGHQGARGARRRATQRRDPLSRRIHHAAPRIHLRVEHQVNRDEIWPDDVPVHMLERQKGR